MSDKIKRYAPVDVRPEDEPGETIGIVNRRVLGDLAKKVDPDAPSSWPKEIWDDLAVISPSSQP